MRDVTSLTLIGSQFYGVTGCCLRLLVHPPYYRTARTHKLFRSLLTTVHLATTKVQKSISPSYVGAKLLKSEINAQMVPLSYVQACIVAVYFCAHIIVFRFEPWWTRLIQRFSAQLHVSQRALTELGISLTAGALLLTMALRFEISKCSFV